MNSPGLQIMEFAKGKTIETFVPLRDGFLIRFTSGESLAAEVIYGEHDHSIKLKYEITGRVTSFNGQPIERDDNG